METLAKVIGVAVLVAVMTIVIVLLGTFLGAFVGWVVGLVFGETILGIFATIGITGFKMWQIGAFLGFVGGFFKTSITKKNND